MASQPMNRPVQVYTTEKAAHLMNVFTALLSIMLLLGWQQLVLIYPLKRGKDDMAHMDPSEITATPFPLENVASFTQLPVVVIVIYWMVRYPTKLGTNLVSLTKASLVVFALFALCGDNMIKNWRLSLLTAIYIGVLAVSTSNGKATPNILEELPFNDFSDLIATCRLYGILLFSIPFQIMSVLDYGNQTSRWPLPILFGGTYGFVIGTLIGLLMIYVQDLRKPINHSNNKEI